ncbi:flagellar hook-length control protein FliK [Stenotrophomonas sp.]|uniref:flagellar hook-length control protein FliK n=1 Tax=Stenotrophomonas sp. TaxID=69392 RepID=UPI002FC83DD2
MPAALLGSTATGGARTPGASARADSPGGSDRQDFDTLLKPDAGRAEKSGPTPKASANKSAGNPAPAADADAAPPGDAGRRPASDDSATPASDAAATTPTSAEKPLAEAGEDADADAAPWPPLGLAGLALMGLAPAAPTPTAVAAASATDPTLAGAPAPVVATPVQAAPAPGLALAAPAAAASEAPAALVLPDDMAVSDDAQLLKAVTDALAGDSADAPAPPLLHALQAAAEVKGTAVGSVFTGSPTATPEVGADDFGDAISARIGWLADQKIGHAVIRVTPHDLGQVEVRLQIDGDKIHASFASAHAEVRHALEASLPRLREMLGEHGFQLGNADVGQQHTAQDGKGGGGQAGTTGGDGEPALAEITVSPAQLMRQRGLVDAYA